MQIPLTPNPNPDTVDRYLEIYEALDTMRQDTDALDATRTELLADAADTEDLATLNAIVAEEQTRIDERRWYVLGTVIGRTALDFLSIRAASLAYVTGHESPEGQQDAAWRVSMYNAILEQVWQNGAVPPRVRQEAFLGDQGKVLQTGVRVYGRTDPTTGRTWISFTDPRTVEYAEPVRVDDRVLAEYDVISSDVNDVGETVAVIRPEGMPERTVIFPANSLVWRINAAGRLELFIPANRSSLGEAELSGLERLVNSLNGITQLAVSAAGANLPNIFTTFDGLRGNPSTIPVAKTA